MTTTRIPRQRPQPPAVSGEVTVSAAASLTEAFTEIGEDFSDANPDATVTFNFGSSATLATQIQEGAPHFLFPCPSIADRLQVLFEIGPQMRVLGGQFQRLAEMRDILVAIEARARWSRPRTARRPACGNRSTRNSRGRSPASPDSPCRSAPCGPPAAWRGFRRRRRCDAPSRRRDRRGAAPGNRLDVDDVGAVAVVDRERLTLPEISTC